MFVSEQLLVSTEMILPVQFLQPLVFLLALFGFDWTPPPPLHPPVPQNRLTQLDENILILSPADLIAAVSTRLELNHPP